MAGLSEALLGLLAALAADQANIAAAITALAHQQRALGAGVVIGSNIFNLAALLGLGAVVAGRIVLHRKVVALLTALTLALAYAGRGLGRWAGWVIIAGYAAFVVAVFIAS